MIRSCIARRSVVAHFKGHVMLGPIVTITFLQLGWLAVHGAICISCFTSCRRQERAQAHGMTPRGVGSLGVAWGCDKEC